MARWLVCLLGGWCPAGGELVVAMQYDISYAGLPDVADGSLWVLVVACGGHVARECIVAGE